MLKTGVIFEKGCTQTCTIKRYLVYIFQTGLVGKSETFVIKTRRSSSKVNDLLPFQYRLHLLDAIQEFVNERRFADARKTLKELKTIMVVELTPKNGDSLQLPNMLQENCYVVERHAHLEIHRLEEVLDGNKLHKVKTHCSVLEQMFGMPTVDEILHQIEHENTINLKMIKKTHRDSFKLYNCDLLMAENLKMCYRILKSCHELKKVELLYCQIDDRTMGILFKALAKLPELMYLGLKGNNLTMESTAILYDFLHDEENFQRLMWIDVSVNGINTLAKTLVDALVQRWPRWVRKNVPSKNVKLSALDIIQGRMPRTLKHK